jgi:hypothetical protein
LDQNLDQRTIVFDQALQLIRTVFPREVVLLHQDPGKWPLSQKYLPHVVALNTAFCQSNPKIGGSVELVRLFNDAGSFLFYWEMRTGAIPLFQSAESICVDLLPSLGNRISGYFSRTLAVLSIYSQCAGIQGRLDALEKNRLAEKMQEQFFQHLEESERTPVIKVEYARTFIDGGWATAQQELDQLTLDLCEKGLMKYKEVGTENTIGVRFGSLYGLQSFQHLLRHQVDNAVKLINRSCELCDDILGVDSYSAIQFTFYKACILSCTGKRQEALQQHTRCWEARQNLLGNSHPDTLSSQYWVAICHQHIGDLETAEYALLLFDEVL